MSRKYLRISQRRLRASSVFHLVRPWPKERVTALSIFMAGIADSRARHSAADRYRLTLKRYAPIASAAAFPARHGQLQVSGYPRRPHRLPDLSLRGRFAPVAISGRQLRFRRKYPIIRPSTARFPRRFAPRNGNSDSLAPPNHHCNTRNCRRRSLSAATDAIGWYVLIGSLQTASAFPRLPRPLWGLAMTHQGSARCTSPPRNDTSDKSAA